MFLYRFFLPDGDGDGGGNMGGESAGPSEPAAPAVDMVDVPETGSVTAEEVAAALGPKYQTVAPAKEEVVNDKPEDPKTPQADVVQEEPAQGPEANPSTPETPKQAEAVATPPADAPDFSFTIKDANDAEIVIKPGDNIEDVLAEFEPRNNGQIIAVLDQFRDAKDKQASYDRDQEAAQAEETRQANVASIQEGWTNEFKQLNVKDESRQAAIFEYMAQQNDARQAAGRPLIASIEDAKLGLEAREATEAAAAAKVEAKETARRNGGLVGGSSAPATSMPPAYKAGSAKNPTQALRQAGLL